MSTVPSSFYVSSLVLDWMSHLSPSQCRQLDIALVRDWMSHFRKNQSQHGYDVRSSSTGLGLIDMDIRIDFFLTFWKGTCSRHLCTCSTQRNMTARQC